MSENSLEISQGVGNGVDRLPSHTDAQEQVRGILEPLSVSIHLSPQGRKSDYQNANSFLDLPNVVKNILEEHFLKAQIGFLLKHDPSYKFLKESSGEKLEVVFSYVQHLTEGSKINVEMMGNIFANDEIVSVLTQLSDQKLSSLLGVIGVGEKSEQFLIDLVMIGMYSKVFQSIFILSDEKFCELMKVCNGLEDVLMVCKEPHIVAMFNRLDQETIEYIMGLQISKQLDGESSVRDDCNIDIETLESIAKDTNLLNWISNLSEEEFNYLRQRNIQTVVGLMMRSLQF